jgi:hypothetical protein
MNCLYITLFFNIVAGIVQTFIKSLNMFIYPPVTAVSLLHFKPHHVFLLLILVAVIQECVEKGKVLLQSQWNPETDLLSLRST